ncbi:uncharacterized protein [Drosophila pseudoobscura]|uniref:Uncharacterized protein isoform X1 n=1 Tax=Drosophila pseudoobscura pseudoobscura TaxID=46245 RepID=A0A6I8V7K9_DROPS|nr:uncharacterized protein LOC6903471 isoform X1 [Drosophila pseudoobscura]XP_015035429.2 uncharacterized protein LOC6903471 isoform X1 [Drosophila pseudoobscura]
MAPVMKLRNPFLNFLDVYRRNHSNMNMVTAAKAGAQRWRHLTDEQRSKFRRNVDMDCHGSGLDSRKRKRGNPGPITNNGYLNFIRKFRQSNRALDLKPQDVIRQAAKAWRRLGDANKTLYRLHKYYSQACKQAMRRQMIKKC